jgi:hypothetical protein
MSTHASGPFEVKMTPQTIEEPSTNKTLARFALDKQFKGSLEATSKGQMLTAGTAVQGSAGYVALELVTGSLNGKAGSFVLQHNGIMDRGTPSLTVTVVPDSGTGELIGLTGSMTIHIAAGAHTYEFDYKLPNPK